MLEEYGVPDEENPEWTREDFAKAKRLDQLPGGSFHEKMQALRADNERYKSEQAQKLVVRLELSRDVVDGLERNGPDWQGQVNQVLREWLAKSQTS